MAVLGGLGGHAESSLLGAAARGLALAPLYAQLLFMPQPVVSTPALARGLVAASAAALAAGLAFSLRRSRPLPLLAVCGVWILAALWLNGLAGDVASWYAVGMLPPFRCSSVARAGRPAWWTQGCRLPARSRACSPRC
jgi:hypothetical protein